MTTIRGNIHVNVFTFKPCIIANERNLKFSPDEFQSFKKKFHHSVVILHALCFRYR
jgi:hypothetical protein